MKHAQFTTIRASVFSLASPKGGEGSLSAEALAKAEGEEAHYSVCPATFITVPVGNSESRQPANAEIVSPSPWGPQCAKRTSYIGHLTRGGLGKPLGRGEGERFPLISNILLARPISVHLCSSVVKNAVSGCVCFAKIRAIRVSTAFPFIMDIVSACIRVHPCPSVVKNSAA